MSVDFWPYHLVVVLAARLLPTFSQERLSSGPAPKHTRLVLEP